MNFRAFDLILFILCGGFVSIAVIFALAAVLAPEFRDTGTTISLGILGALGTLLTTALGARTLANGRKDQDHNDPT